MEESSTFSMMLHDGCDTLKFIPFLNRYIPSLTERASFQYWEFAFFLVYNPSLEWPKDVLASKKAEVLPCINTKEKSTQAR